MEISIEINKIALILGFLGLLVAFCACGYAALLNVWLTRLILRVEAIEDILKEEERCAKEEEKRLSEAYSVAGKKGVQVRAENKEMRTAAMDEGRVLLSQLTPDVLTNQQKQVNLKNQLAGLAMKYPKVADEVADSLIREFKLDAYGDLIKGVVRNALMNPSPQSTPKEEYWYGIKL